MQPKYDGEAQGGDLHELQNHIHSLDGLRGLAALLVVFSHIGFFGIAPLLNAPIGNYGVFLFFVLSGFLMGHLYLAKTITRDRAKTYLAARISRIVPIYYLVIVVAFLYGRYVDTDFTYAMSPLDFVRHLAFVGTVSVFWSIGPEFQFYFLFPLLWWLVSQPANKALRWGLPTLALLSVILLFRTAWPGILVLSKIHIFLAGILIGVLRPYMVDAIDRRTALVAQLCATAFILFLFLPQEIVGTTIYPHTIDDIRRNDYYADFGKLFPLAFVVMAFSFPTSYANTIFANRIAKLVGKYSFSIYLFHVPVLYTFQHSGILTALPYPVAIGTLLGGIMLLCAMSFYVVEEPSRVVVRRWLMAILRTTGSEGLPETKKVKTDHAISG